MRFRRARAFSGKTRPSIRSDQRLPLNWVGMAGHLAPLSPHAGSGCPHSSSSSSSSSSSWRRRARSIGRPRRMLVRVKRCFLRGEHRSPVRLARIRRRGGPRSDAAFDPGAAGAGLECIGSGEAGGTIATVDRSRRTSGSRSMRVRIRRRWRIDRPSRRRAAPPVWEGRGPARRRGCRRPPPRFQEHRVGMRSGMRSVASSPRSSTLARS